MYLSSGCMSPTNMSSLCVYFLHVYVPLYVYFLYMHAPSISIFLCLVVFWFVHCFYVNISLCICPSFCMSPPCISSSIYMSPSCLCLFHIYIFLFDCFFISILPLYMYFSKYTSLRMHIPSVYISLHVISLCMFLPPCIFLSRVCFLRIYVTSVYMSPLCVCFFV